MALKPIEPGTSTVLGRDADVSANLTKEKPVAGIQRQSGKPPAESDILVREPALTGGAGVVEPGGCAGPTTAAQVRAIERELEAHLIAHHPQVAYAMGMQPREAKLADLSLESMQEEVDFYETLLTRLDASEFDPKGLSARDGLAIAQLRSAATYRLHWLRDWGGPLRVLAEGPALEPANLTQEQISKIRPDTREADWREIAGRLQNIDTYLEQHADNLRRGLELGLVPHAAELAAEIGQSEDAAAFFAQGLLASARDSLGEAFAGHREVLESIARKAAAAYAHYAEFLAAEAQPLAIDEYALGRQEYAWRLEQMGIEQTPEQLHREGWDIAQSIEQRMTELARQIDPDATLAEVVEGLKADHPKDDEELLALYRDACDSALEFVTNSGAFSIPEGYELDVRETPPSMRATAPTAAYLPAPPLDRSGKGVFLVTPSEGNIDKLRYHNVWALQSTAVHEAFPGHDLQFYSFQQRAAGSARLALLLDMGGFGHAASLNLEGYALYAEEFMRSNGFFTEPRAELAQLKKQLWRAYRIVIDTGLHTGALGFDEAVKILTDRVMMSPVSARNEVLRYSMMPTQAITYMVGRRQIEALKDQYREILGPYYEERGFHEMLYAFGPVPPSQLAPIVLEEARAKRAALDGNPQLAGHAYRDPRD